MKTSNFTLYSVLKRRKVSTSKAAFSLKALCPFAIFEKDSLFFLIGQSERIERYNVRTVRSIAFGRFEHFELKGPIGYPDIFEL